MTYPSARVTNLLGFGICLGLLGYAYYTQFAEQLEPCPLCIFQRVAMIGLAVLFLIAAAHNPGKIGARVYGIALAVAGTAGAAVAAWHVRLQHLPPDQVPECGPGLDYMLDVFPLGEALRMAFTGSGECAEISWSFLGLSMPAWVLVWFVVLGLGGLLRNFASDSR